MQLFKQKSKQRYLTYLSLFAVLMLTLGPVTSQILAMVAHDSHTANMSQHETMHHSQHHNTTLDTEKSQTHNSKFNHHMSLCDYCDLLHTPVLTTYIPLVIQVSPIHQNVIPYHLDDIFSPLYNSALSRAPPSYLIS